MGNKTSTEKMTEYFIFLLGLHRPDALAHWKPSVQYRGGGPIAFVLREQVSQIRPAPPFQAAPATGITWRQFHGRSSAR